ncbi:MAG: HDIG domain-containing metalloprotein [Patescibacteria group bacterium]
MRSYLRRRLPLIGLVTVVSIALTVIITQPTTGSGRIESGEVANQTYKSPRTLTYQSKLKTEEAERRVAEQVSPVYRRDLTASSQQQAKLNATLEAVSDIRGSRAAERERIDRMAQVLPNVREDEARTILALGDRDWQRATTVTRDILDRLQDTRITQEGLAQSRELVTSRLPRDLPPSVRSSVVVLGQRLLVPNYLIDEEATQRAKDEARDSVQPVSYTVERDQVVLAQGTVVTPFDVERLEALGLTRPSFDYQKTIAVFLLVLIFTAVLLRFSPGLAGAKHPRRLAAGLIITAIGLVLGAVLIVPPQPILAYVIPVAAVPLLVSVFYGSRPALVAGLSYAALYGLAAGASFELLFIHLAASTVVVATHRRLTDIQSFLRAGAIGGVVVFVGMVGFSLLAANFDPANLPKFAVAAALNGALLSTITFAGAAFLAGPLGVVTFLQLLELENPRRPLLRRLAAEAPGTYSHSVHMASMVENVAKRLDGADPLLARVQALYHDIGKITMPEFFVENNRDERSPHQGLEPKESADVLRAHISEGLALAHAARLPDQVAAAIPEHHGTTRMEFFWQAARKRYRRTKEADYRYIGPRPRSKETALIMLADAAESASRTLSTPDEKRIRALVHRLINDRIEDGQLDEAPLSTKELTTIKEAFVEGLVGDLHKRIKYPKRRGR